MQEYTVRITGIERLTHDVKRFRTEIPEGYSFIPGQATSVSINRPELRKRMKPFTFTGTVKDPFLEFIIKIYPDHKGFTDELDRVSEGDELIIRPAWGAISYKGEGIFIAGGAGITPFVSIFRDLRLRNELQGNTLLFANKTRADIILEKELGEMLGKAFVNILSEEKSEGYFHGFIDEEFLKTHAGGGEKRFYVCGPPPMMKAVLSHLASLGVDKGAITLEF
jgi:ferredoxin-NADP reductase